MSYLDDFLKQIGYWDNPATLPAQQQQQVQKENNTQDQQPYDEERERQEAYANAAAELAEKARQAALTNYRGEMGNARGQPGDAVLRPGLHLHDMGDGVRCPGIRAVELDGAPADALGRGKVAALLQAEGVAA